MKSLTGQGFVAIWNGIRSGNEADFERWHREEHMPERLAIPGFLRGQRWGAETGEGYFTLYTLTDAEVARSSAYLGRLNDPTPWTRRVMTQFTNNSRCVGSFAESLGIVPADRVLIAPLAGNHPGLCEQARSIPGVAGCHLGLSDLATSALPTVERQGRPVAEPAGVLILSLTQDADATAISGILHLPADAAAFGLQIDRP